MKTNLKNVVGLGFKYYLLSVLGLAIALVVSQVFGAISIVGLLISPGLWIWCLRLAVSLLCLLAIAMILESWS